MEKIYFNNLRVKYLKHYLNGQIKIFKKMKKKYLQSGGNPKEVNPPERKKIRIPFLASFTQDLPNMIFTYIELYERIEKILKILVCISKKYDKTGKMTQTLLYINNLLGFIRVYIALQRSFINITKGLWNDQLVKKINNVDTRMLAPIDKSDPDYEMFKEWMDKYHKERSKMSPVTGGGKKYQASIYYGGKEKSTFDTKEQADIAYDRVAIDKNPEVVSNTLNYPKMSDREREEARELAAIAKVTHDLVNASKNAVMNATKTLDIVWREKGNPIDKINDAISDVNTAALDAIGTAPPLALMAGPLKLFGHTTKISSDLIDVLDSVATAVEKILEEQVVVESDGTCKVPILDLIIQLKNLSQRSPHIAKLIGAAAIDVGDRVIDSQAPNHENLNMFQSSEPHARMAAQLLLNSAENQINDPAIQKMNDQKQRGLQAYQVQNASTATPVAAPVAAPVNAPAAASTAAPVNAPVNAPAAASTATPAAASTAGGSKKKSLKKRKKKSLKKRKRKKRTKKKTLKK
jgi:hypothetical protein